MLKATCSRCGEKARQTLISCWRETLFTDCQQWITPHHYFFLCLTFASGVINLCRNNQQWTRVHQGYITALLQETASTERGQQGQKLALVNVNMTNVCWRCHSWRPFPFLICLNCKPGYFLWSCRNSVCVVLWLLPMMLSIESPGTHNFERLELLKGRV